MGCVSLQKEKLLPMVPTKTVNGLLRVTIEEANISKPPSALFSLDPYLKIRMSNQQYRGFIHRKAGRLDLFNETFQFIINSCYKPQGRSVEIQVWDKHMFGDKIIGVGMVDIDPIINFDQDDMLGSQALKVNYIAQNNELQRLPSKFRTSNCKRKIFLSNRINQVGYLNAKFQFIQQPVIVVGFKFIYASMQRVSSIFTTMNIRIQVVAGQQVLSTQKHKDKDTKNPPSWQDEILMFNIPTSLKQCVIRVLDDDIEVGRYKLQFSEIIGQKGEHTFTQQLESDHGLSGVIKFIALVGVTSILNDSKKILKMQESRQKINSQIQPLQLTKIQLPSQKQTKLYDSEAKTNFQTQANEQELSKSNLKPQNSILFIDQHEMRH